MTPRASHLRSVRARAAVVIRMCGLTSGLGPIVTGKPARQSCSGAALRPQAEPHSRAVSGRTLRRAAHPGRAASPRGTAGSASSLSRTGLCGALRPALMGRATAVPVARRM